MIWGGAQNDVRPADRHHGSTTRTDGGPGLPAHRAPVRDTRRTGCGSRRKVIEHWENRDDMGTPPSSAGLPRPRLPAADVPGHPASPARRPPVNDPARALARLTDGYLSTQLLYVAARLGVADALVGGPRRAAELAAKVGARPGPLHRVLRGLAADGVLDELPDGRFTLTGRAVWSTECRQRGGREGRGQCIRGSGAVDAVQEARTSGPASSGARRAFFVHLAAQPERTRLRRRWRTGRPRANAVGGLRSTVPRWSTSRRARVRCGRSWA